MTGRLWDAEWTAVIARWCHAILLRCGRAAAATYVSPTHLPWLAGGVTRMRAALPPSPSGLIMTHLAPPPMWGRSQVGGKAAPVCTPTPTLPHRGGGERGPWGKVSSAVLQAFAQMWVKRSPPGEGGVRVGKTRESACGFDPARRCRENRCRWCHGGLRGPKRQGWFTSKQVGNEGRKGL
jgi:hypothetical protein